MVLVVLRASQAGAQTPPLVGRTAVGMFCAPARPAAAATDCPSVSVDQAELWRSLLQAVLVAVSPDV